MSLSSSDDDFSSEDEKQQSTKTTNKNSSLKERLKKRIKSKEEPEKAETKSLVNSTNNKKLQIGFQWNGNSSSLTNVTETENDSDSDSEEEKEIPKTNTKKTSQKKEESDEDEEEETSTNRASSRYHLTETEISEIEESLTKKLPTSEADFERLLVGEPNSSFLWIQYITFMLNTYGFDKAKAIAERAINRIHPTKEKEKLNVYSALLSLYISNNKDVEPIIQRAAQSLSQPHVIYLQYATILNKLFERKVMNLKSEQLKEDDDEEDEEQSNQMIDYKSNKELNALVDKIEDIFKKACKKFKSEKKVYEEYIQWCICNLKDIKKGDQVLQRTFKVFPKKDHVSLSAKFAVILYKGNFIQEARNNMETIIQNNPKRSDIWSMYLDCEQKVTQEESYIRDLFERICNLSSLSTKKMKSFLQRYLKFENENGDKDRQEHVKELAKEYIQNKLQKTSE
ncbi:hypothetical protein ABK040_015539 [Willaertia magna]